VAAVTPAEDFDPSRCHACRGTGRVQSTLGGDPHDVTCPWCEGTGRFISGHDAQAAERGGEPSARAAHLEHAQHPA
jgi:DnaJ-class molecular chaperone